MSYQGQGGPADTVGAQSRPQLLLAAALALLIHVITGLVLLARAPEEEPTERTVQVQLVEQGIDTDAQKSSRATAASTPPVEPLAQAASENLPAASPVEPPAEAVAPVLASQSERVTTQSERNAQARQQPPEPQQPETPTTERRAEAPEAVADRSPRPQLTRDALQQPATQPSRSAAAAPSGAPDASSPLEPEEHRQVSSQPDLPQMDPYQLILSRHMMRPIKQFLQRESTLKQFNQAVEAGTQPITIELKLLANGAVRRVQLKESSGSEFVDRIAVQSALAASPYPPPPEEERPNGFRFRLHLIMSPVYL